MILDALKNFGPSKPSKPDKPGKPGRKGTHPKMDKKFAGDTGSKETIRDSSRTKDKKSPPPPAKKSPIQTIREKTPAREKTPIKKPTPLSSKRN